MTNKAKFLVLIDGYVESSSTTFLVISKMDGSRFIPEEAGAELVEIVKRSYEEKPWNNLLTRNNHRDDVALEDMYAVTDLVRNAYWGTADSTGWNWDEMNNAGWTDGEFPTYEAQCYFVNENAVEWMLQCWEMKNPNWRKNNDSNSNPVIDSIKKKLTPSEFDAISNYIQQGS